MGKEWLQKQQDELLESRIGFGKSPLRERMENFGSALRDYLDHHEICDDRLTMPDTKIQEQQGPTQTQVPSRVSVSSSDSSIVGSELDDELDTVEMVKALCLKTCQAEKSHEQSRETASILIEQTSLLMSVHEERLGYPHELIYELQPWAQALRCESAL